MSKTFCPLPWVHLATHPHGGVSLCCESDMSSRMSDAYNICDEKKFFYDLNKLGTEYNLLSLMNNDNFKNVRRIMLKGEVPVQCEKCFLLEKKGLKSKRFYESERLSFTLNDAVMCTHDDGSITNTDLEFIELRLGNICNLKCRTCNPVGSKKWYPEWKLLSGTDFPLDEKKFRWPDSDHFWKELKNHVSDNLRYIYINGGEPFLVDKHISFLEFLADEGYSSNIVLEYSTNGTIYHEKYINIWKMFKEVKLKISIDDIDNRLTYIRYPAKWGEVYHNLKKFEQLVAQKINLKIEIMQTVSVLNVYYIDEFFEYFSKKFPSFTVARNYVSEPIYYNSQIIPEHIRSSLINKMKFNLLNDELRKYFSESVFPYEHFTKFFDITNSLDKIRKQSFEKTFPEWFYILKKKE